MEFNPKNLLAPPSQLFKQNLPDKNNILEGLKIGTPVTVKTQKDSFSLSPLKYNKIPVNLSLGLNDINTSKFTLGSIFNKSEAPVKTKGVAVNVGISAQHLGGLPPRPANAVSGSQFIDMTRNMSRANREKAILQEINNGNVPDFVRNMKDVTVTTTGSDGKKHTGTIHVIPDYLAIGSNNDFIRIPMDPLTAQKIADKTGTILPTKKMVDTIYQQAEAKMTPQPIQASPQMMSNEYYENHNHMVELQRDQKGYQLGQLIAGHQKDVVITNRLDQNTGKVAIYGWHQPNGKPIQPLSTIHENTYADYSHGIRLVSKTMKVDGKNMNIDDVLKNPNLSKLLSDEGPISDSRASR